MNSSRHKSNVCAFQGFICCSLLYLICISTANMWVLYVWLQYICRYYMHPGRVAFIPVDVYCNYIYIYIHIYRIQQNYSSFYRTYRPTRSDKITPKWTDIQGAPGKSTTLNTTRKITHKAWNQIIYNSLIVFACTCVYQPYVDISSYVCSITRDSNRESVLVSWIYLATKATLLPWKALYVAHCYHIYIYIYIQ